MEIRLYFQMMQRGWWVIVLSALIALASSLGISYLAIPQYQAVSRFIVSPGAALSSGRDVLSSLDTLDRRSVVATYAEIMNSRRILTETVTSLGMTESDAEEYSIQAVELPDAFVLELSVSGPNPKIASDLANTIGFETIRFANDLHQVYDINILDLAVPPEKPVSPQPLRDAGVATFLGLVAGIVLAVLSEQMRIPLEMYRKRLRVDGVTGVYNKRYFLELLEDEVRQNSQGTLSIGIIELTGFRDLLETLPIGTSQAMLKEITGAFQKELRGNDIIGRWNEYSFVTMLPTTAGSAANRIFDRVFQHLTNGNGHKLFDADVRLDPHIGGAEYNPAITAQELVNMAQTALEKARADATRPIYVSDIKSPFWIQPQPVAEE